MYQHREDVSLKTEEDEGTHLYGLDLLVVSSSQGRSDATGWICTNVEVLQAMRTCSQTSQLKNKKSSNVLIISTC